MYKQAQKFLNNDNNFLLNDDNNFLFKKIITCISEQVKHLVDYHLGIIIDPLLTLNKLHMCESISHMHCLSLFKKYNLLTKGGQIKYPTMHHFQLYYQRADAKITSF